MLVQGQALTLCKVPKVQYSIRDNVEPYINSRDKNKSLLFDDSLRRTCSTDFKVWIFGEKEQELGFTITTRNPD